HDFYDALDANVPRRHVYALRSLSVTVSPLSGLERVHADSAADSFSHNGPSGRSKGQPCRIQNQRTHIHAAQLPSVAQEPG
ncbi:MAG: hypothetical protein L0H22_08830, partial [Brevibacterium aurantiacum]|nr:hypothetical protein [Brevibacterium aurantiacum]